MRITHHELQISDPKTSLYFYQNILGMKLLNCIKTKNKTQYFLTFNHNVEASLVLVYMPNIPFEVATQPSKTEGYWKISIAVSQLEEVREILIRNEVTIGQCFEVPNLAYLCHLTDPDGYCIELIQQTLKVNTPKIDGINHHMLDFNPTFNLCTLRVKNIQKSLPFYNSLGFELIYTYQSKERAMSLYFLIAKNDEKFKQACSLTGVEQAMWQHSSTILELQQFDNTAQASDFSYNTNTNTGFLGLSIKDSAKNIQQYCSISYDLPDGKVQETSTALCDPDGYQIHYYS